MSTQSTRKTPAPKKPRHIRYAGRNVLVGSQRERKIQIYERRQRTRKQPR